jgi:glycoside/pentoside/hexuronide:cation symporter, GPH family
MNQGARKVPLSERILYGSGDMASCLFWMTIMTQLLYFYTEVFGISPVAAGMMFLVSRVLDALFDVVIGMTADRTRSRWGKFRPYILFGAVPLAVIAVIAFTTPDFPPWGKLIYAYATFIAFMFLYSTVNIPYTALLGVISNDPAERTSAASFKFVGAYLGGMIVAMTILPFAAHLGHGNPQKGWQLTLALYGAVAVVLFLITFLSTRERIQPIARERTSIGQDLRDISQNLPWLLLFGVTILFILFVCIRMSVTTHYFKYYVAQQESPVLARILNFLLAHVVNPAYALVGRPPAGLFAENHRFGWETLTSAFNTTGQALSLVGVLLVPVMGKLVGRKRATVILFAASLVCTAAFYLCGPHDLIGIFLLQAVGSLVGGPVSALLWVLYADTADYSEWRTGRRATGLVFSASIMSNKLGWAIGSMLAGLILAGTGYVANQAQSLGVQSGIKAMMSVIPVGIGVVALVMLAYFYRLDDKTMAKVKCELDERRRLAEENAAVG